MEDDLAKLWTKKTETVGIGIGMSWQRIIDVGRILFYIASYFCILFNRS